MIQLFILVLFGFNSPFVKIINKIFKMLNESFSKNFRPSHKVLCRCLPALPEDHSVGYNTVIGPFKFVHSVACFNAVIGINNSKKQML
jgi:hypothetical protein